MEGPLVEARVAQPDDSTLVACTLYFVVMVCSELVCLDVPMCHGVVMVGAFVHVLHRHEGCADEPRRECQHEESATEPGEHSPIMGGQPSGGQPVAPADSGDVLPRTPFLLLEVRDYCISSSMPENAALSFSAFLISPQLR